MKEKPDLFSHSYTLCLPQSRFPPFLSPVSAQNRGQRLATLRDASPPRGPDSRIRPFSPMIPPLPQTSLSPAPSRSLVLWYPPWGSKTTSLRRRPRIDSLLAPLSASPPCPRALPYLHLWGRRKGSGGWAQVAWAGLGWGNSLNEHLAMVSRG